MRTIAEWQVILTDTRRQLRNCERRGQRASDKWQDIRYVHETCNECGHSSLLFMSDGQAKERAALKDIPEYIKWCKEDEERIRLWSLVWDIDEWMDTLRKYNKGEPKI